MQNGLQSEIDKALGLTSQPAPPPPPEAGKIAQARQTAALQAEMQSLQTRLFRVEKALESLNSTATAKEDAAAGILRRLKALEEAAIAQGKSQAAQARSLKILTRTSQQTRSRLLYLTIAVAVLAVLTIVSILL